MQQMRSYGSYITERGDVVVVIPFFGMNDPLEAELLYAGGEHALFYKTSEQKIVLDYLNEIVRPVLSQSNRILLFEVDTQKQTIEKNYFVPVKHVDQLPEFSLELKIA